MKKYVLLCALCLAAGPLKAVGPGANEKAERAAPSRIVSLKSQSASGEASTCLSIPQPSAPACEPPESLKQIARFAGMVQVGWGYEKGSGEDTRTAQCLVSLKDILNLDPEGALTIKLSRGNNCCTDEDGDDQKQSIQINTHRSDLNLDSLPSLLNSLEKKLAPHIDTWIVTNDQGNLQPLKEKKSMLMMIFLAQHLPKHVLFEGVEALLLISPDTHGMDTWRFPDLQATACFTVPLRDKEHVFTPIPRCILSADVLRIDEPERFSLACPFTTGLPSYLEPYLQGSPPKIKISYNAGKNEEGLPSKVRVPFFEHAGCSLLGSADFEMQDPTIGHNPIAFTDQGKISGGLLMAMDLRSKLCLAQQKSRNKPPRPPSNAYTWQTTARSIPSILLLMRMGIRRAPSMRFACRLRS